MCGPWQLSRESPSPRHQPVHPRLTHGASCGEKAKKKNGYADSGSPLPSDASKIVRVRATTTTQTYPGQSNLEHTHSCRYTGTMKKGVVAAAAVVLLLSPSTAVAFVCPAYPGSSPQMFSSTSDARSQHHNGLRRTRQAGSISLLVTSTSRGRQQQQQISTPKTTVTRMASFDSSSFDSAAPPAFPQGPGAGVIDLRFENLKAGGFKVFLLLFLLGVSDVRASCS